MAVISRSSYELVTAIDIGELVLNLDHTPLSGAASRCYPTSEPPPRGLLGQVFSVA